MQSQYIRYEVRVARAADGSRTGTKVVPVRIVKQWDEREVRLGRLGREMVKADAKTERKFKSVRVTELKMRDVRGDREQAPEAWTSSPARVESRERLLGLVVKYELECGGEPVLRDPTGGPCLSIGELPWAYQQHIPLEAEPESREWHMRRQWAEARGWGDEDELGPDNSYHDSPTPRAW